MNFFFFLTGLYFSNLFYCSPKLITRMTEDEFMICFRNVLREFLLLFLLALITVVTGENFLKNLPIVALFPSTCCYLAALVLPFQTFPSLAAISLISNIVLCYSVAQRVKRLSAMREIWVQSLGWEDPLKKEMGTYSSILAWKIPWTEKAGGLQFMGSQKSWTWLSD